MPAHRRKECLLWQPFLDDPTGTVIVLPSPHNSNNHGISYCDACAMGEIIANLQNCQSFVVRSPEQLGSDIRKNLILISGPKVNSVTRELYNTQEMHLIFRLEDGVIYDQDKHVIMTSRYPQGATHTIEHLIMDYGLILYMDNPFGLNTKILHLAGIRGCGTFAAAIAATEDSLLQHIEQQLAKHPAFTKLAKPTLEVLVKVCASQGRVERETVSIDKLTVHHGRSRWSWASKSYRYLNPVTPHRISVTLSTRTDSSPSFPTITVDDQEFGWAKSANRRNLLYCLTKHAKEDYFTGSDNAGWVMASDLANELWHIMPETGMVELSPELRRCLADSILTWVRHLSKLGQIKIDETIHFDHQYINSEILVCDHDLKKRVTDLVYIINHESKETFGSDFPLITTQHGRGYRLNIHPALISLTPLSQS